MNLKEYNNAVDRFADNLYRFVVKNCRDEECAQDVVQDSFEKLWLKMEKVDQTKIKSYLFTTAYHTMLDYLKKQKRTGEMTDSVENQLQHEDQYNDLSEILEIALKRLPEIQRTVILLRDYEGYSYEDIGEICGLTESQVKVYIYRGRIKLKEYLVNLENVI